MSETTLEGIFLEKFQSIDQATFIKLNGLTFLYGPNSAGKSSIVDAIELLKGVVGGPDHARKASSSIKSHRNPDPLGWSESRIGVELKATDILDENVAGFDDENKYWTWRRQLSRGFAFDPSNFFKKIDGQKIQIEFSRNFSTLKVAVNGDPLFSILNEVSFFDDFACITDKENCNDDLTLLGAFVVYKNNPLGKSLFESIFNLEDWYRSYHFKHLFEVTDNSIKLRGIYRDLNNDKAEICSIDELYLDEHLFPSDRAKAFTRNAKPSETEKEWLKTSHPNSRYFKLAQKRRTNLYWKIHEIWQEVSVALDGLMMLLHDALTFSHVEGSRSILDSKKPFSSHLQKSRLDYSKENPLKAILNKNTSPAISQYAQRLGDEGFTHLPKYSIMNRMVFDFPNYCLKSHLKSLSHYQFFSIKTTFSSISEKYSDEFDTLTSYLRIRQDNNLELGFEQVGSGLSFIFPILVSLWSHELTVVEQPELHLHPKAQCEMGDVFIATSYYGHRAVIESHSEHILLRVLRRIRETTAKKELSPELRLHADKVSIYYFEPVGSGITHVKQIRIDKYGELIDSWPGGFFAEREGELF